MNLIKPPREQSQKKYSEKVGLTRDDCNNAKYSENLELDISTISPSIARPKRPQDRIDLKNAKESYQKEVSSITSKGSSSQINLDGKILFQKSVVEILIDNSYSYSQIFYITSVLYLIGILFYYLLIKKIKN